MVNTKTAGKLPIFDPQQRAAAAAVLEPVSESRVAEKTTSARNRKAGGRGVRISGYISSDVEMALRDEVVRRTVAERRTISFNDVLCAALDYWRRSQGAPQ
jgi:hypothetical protein